MIFPDNTGSTALAHAHGEDDAATLAIARRWFEQFGCLYVGPTGDEAHDAIFLTLDEIDEVADDSLSARALKASAALFSIDAETGPPGGFQWIRAAQTELARIVAA